MQPFLPIYDPRIRSLHRSGSLKRLPMRLTRKAALCTPAALTCSMITGVRAQSSKRIILSGVPTVKKLISIFMTAVLLTIGLCASATPGAIAAPAGAKGHAP